jgi:hypothetical protein
MSKSSCSYIYPCLHTIYIIEVDAGRGGVVDPLVDIVWSVLGGLVTRGVNSAVLQCWMSSLWKTGIRH